MLCLQFYMSYFLKNCQENKILRMTQFEIECRCGKQSVTKKLKTILPILLAKPKLGKK